MTEEKLELTQVLKGKMVSQAIDIASNEILKAFNVSKIDSRQLFDEEDDELDFVGDEEYLAVIFFSKEGNFLVEIFTNAEGFVTDGYVSKILNKSFLSEKCIENKTPKKQWYEI